MRERVDRLRYLAGKVEALVLLLIASAVVYFSVGGNYRLLMNERFRWLSVSGGVLLLVMGLALLATRQRGSFQGVGALLLLVLIVAIGKPYQANVNSNLNLLPELERGLKSDIDETRFTPMKLQSLFAAEDRPRHGVVTLGAVKRLSQLDERGGFALMDSLMICCAADMFGIGLYVPVDNLADYEDGDLLVVCGTVEKADAPIEVENFRFGNATLSVVHQQHYLQPETILPYDRIAAMPLLTDLMEYDRVGTFRRALIESGLWETLQGEGDITVFAPIDAAFESSGEAPAAGDEVDRSIEVLSIHIVPGRLFTRDLYGRERLDTINGKRLRVELSNGTLKIGGARLLLGDREARNGVLHLVHPLAVADNP